MLVDRCRLLVLALVVGVLTVTAGPTGAAHARDKDCGDFPNQAAAQRYFLDHGGPQQDPDRLDADGDGIACESDPCPCSSAQGGTPAPVASLPPRTVDAAVVDYVVDGDTIDVTYTKSGREARIRLLGVDTPEVYGGVECGGPAASAAAERLLPVGTHVTLISDPSQARVDRYGRDLRYVAKAGHVDVSRAQIRTGRGVVYVYEHHPFKRVKPYRAAQRYARSHHLGLWKTCR